MKGIILLSYDIMFKHIFETNKNKKFTSNMLECLLNLEEGYLRNIKVLNSVVLDKKEVNSKRLELDVLVELPDKSEIVLEMQRIYDENAKIKNTLYIMDKFESKLKVGEEYNRINSILGVFFIKEDYLHKNNEVIKRYGITI